MWCEECGEWAERLGSEIVSGGRVIERFECPNGHISEGDYESPRLWED